MIQANIVRPTVLRPRLASPVTGTKHDRYGILGYICLALGDYHLRNLI
jgi:hypothetical protein